MSKIKEYREIPLDKISISEHNVRDDIPPLSHLEESILEKGVLQPIIVKEKENVIRTELMPKENGEYEVVAGQLRVIACKNLEIEKIPAIVKDIDDEEEVEESLIENVTKAELMPEEMANAVKQLYEQYGSQRELVAVLGKSRRWIRKRLQAAGLAEVLEEEGGPHGAHLPSDFHKTADISRVVMKVWKKEPEKIKEFLKKTEDRSRKDMKQILKFIEKHSDWSVDKILEEADKEMREIQEQEQEVEEEEAVEEPVEEVAEPEEVEKLDVYACPICGKEFKKESSVNMHMISVHKKSMQSEKERIREIGEIEVYLIFKPTPDIGKALTKYTKDNNISVDEFICETVPSAVQTRLKEEGYL